MPRPMGWRSLGFGTALERIGKRSKRSRSGCLVWSGNLNNGVPQIRITVSGEVWTESAHRVVWYSSGRHIDSDSNLKRTCCNPRCVELSHLAEVGNGEMASEKERGIVRDKLVRAARARRRLSDARVRTIRRRHSKGKPIRLLAERYGVSVSTIYAVASGRIYRDVGD
jgi:hypothetical protein